MSFDLGTLYEGFGIMAKAWDIYDQYDALGDKHRSDARVYAGDYDLDMKGAQDAKDRGVRTVEGIRRKGMVVGGKQRSAMGVSGVEAGKGSFAKVLQDTQDFTEQDAGTAWENALRESYGYEISATNARNRSQQASQQAERDDDNAWIGTLGSLASGLAGFF